MTTLVIAEHKQHALHPATRATITAAKALQQPITVLVAGHDCDAAAKQAAQCDGVSQVLAHRPRSKLDYSQSRIR